MPELRRAARAPREVAAVPLERAVMHAIREALGAEPDLVLWRNSVAGVEAWDPRTGNTRVHHAGLGNGSSDLVGILRVDVVDPRAEHGVAILGRFFALEVKRPGGRVEPHQVAWLELVRRFGGFAAVVHSAEEARAALERARRGELT